MKKKNEEPASGGGQNPAKALAISQGEAFRLHTLLHGILNASDALTRMSLFGDLGDWLHGRTRLGVLGGDPEFGLRNQRMRELLKELFRDTSTRIRFQVALRDSIANSSLLHVLCASGLPREHGFYGDLFERLLGFALPQSPEPSNVSDLLSHMFPSPDDGAWIRSWSPAEFAAVRSLVGTGRSTENEPSVWASSEIPLCLKVLSASLVSCAFSDDVVRRLKGFERGPALFVDLLDESARFVMFLENAEGEARSPEEMGEKAQPMVVLLAAARSRTQAVLTQMESTGASLPLVYRLERMLAVLDRIERLVSTLTSGAQTQQLQSFVAHLVEGIHSDRSVRILLQRNLSLIARNVVERISESGETYIARSYVQWKKVLKGAAGGGILTCFTGAIKLAISASSIPLLMSGLAHSLNYASSFVLMQVFHFKLATKQPAFFAGAIAAKIDRRSLTAPFPRATAASQDVLLQEIKFIARSQSATLIGNLLFVFPMCLVFDFFWLLATGHSYLDLSEARKVFVSLDPLRSGTLWYAAITGAILFFSSLVGSWFQNFLNNRGVSEGIIHSRWMMRALGQKRAHALAVGMSESSGSFGTSVALGFMLGFVPILGTISGLPLDVRHVTLSMAQLTLAIASPGILGFEWLTTLMGLIGILIIGIGNFAVSFFLGLWLALRARGLTLSDAFVILGEAGRALVRRPTDFLLPKRSEGA